jgi:crossover junction endodeoxyribonuclease RuvC
MRIVGIDPGFANLGLAAVELHQPAGSTLLGIKLVRTQPTAKKQRMAAADDESRRLAEIEDAMISFFDEYKPDIVAMENPPWGKNAHAVKSCALMWGAAHCLCRTRGLVLINVSAQEIKKALTGNKSASKEEVFDAVKSKHPTFTKWPTIAAVEHVADAAGAALTIRNHPLVFALLGRAGLPAHRT